MRRTLSSSAISPICWKAGTSNISSWAWIFWTAAAVTPLMILCIYFGIPQRAPSGPIPSWRGFAYFSASLALIYGALDQAERLDWLNSGIIVAMLAGRSLLIHRDLHPADRTAESDPEPLVSEPQEHDHSGAIDFCVQVRAPLGARPGAGVPEHDSRRTGRSRPDMPWRGSQSRCSRWSGWLRGSRSIQIQD